LCVNGFSESSTANTVEIETFFFDKFKEKVENEYKDLKVIILGPSPCNIPKINNKYRYRLIIKCKNNKKFRDLILKLLVDVQANAKYKYVTLFADINPENII